MLEAQMIPINSRPSYRHQIFGITAIKMQRIPARSSQMKYLILLPLFGRILTIREPMIAPKKKIELMDPWIQSCDAEMPYGPVMW